LGAPEADLCAGVGEIHLASILLYGGGRTLVDGAVIDDRLDGYDEWLA
jgi:hypothetical protein